jgi:hypothetical protein
VVKSTGDNFPDGGGCKLSRWDHADQQRYRLALAHLDTEGRLDSGVMLLAVLLIGTTLGSLGMLRCSLNCTAWNPFTQSMLGSACLLTSDATQ